MTWLLYCAGAATAPSILLPFFPLEFSPLNPARGMGERCKLPSGVWGSAEIEYGAFYL